MQPPGEAVLDWEEAGIVLPSLEDGGEAEEEALCLIALASFMGNGRISNVVYWNMMIARDIASITKTKAETAIKERLFIW